MAVSLTQVLAVQFPRACGDKEMLIVVSENEMAPCGSISSMF